jgi:hypothetical protein
MLGPMSARSVFAVLEAADEPGRRSIVERWVFDNAEETVHLDFKTAESQAGEPGVQDNKNLAKGISAFANTEGGLLVFGIKTKRNANKIDRADKLAPVQNVSAFAARLESLWRDRTDPPVFGLRHMVIPASPGSGSGFVVILVPESHGGPHRVTNIQGDREMNDKYYGRLGASSGVLSHRHLAAMFASRPAPRLKLIFERFGPAMVRVALTNTGRGLAERIRVSLGLAGDGREWQLPNFVITVEGWKDVSRDARFHVVLETPVVLYQHDSVALGHFAPTWHSGFEPVKNWQGCIRARIDAENMQPVEFEEPAPSAKVGEVTYPKDDG